VVKVRVYVEGRVVEVEVPGPLSVYKKGGSTPAKGGK
jgi:hypothetical protein